MKHGYDENNNYNKCDETKCATNYSFITQQQVEREHAQQFAAHNAQ